MPPRLCPQCSAPVHGHGSRKFCSDRCKRGWWRRAAQQALATPRAAEQASRLAERELSTELSNTTEAKS